MSQKRFYRLGCVCFFCFEEHVAIKAVVEGEEAALGASEGCEGGEGAEFFAEVVGKGADVGPFRAADVEFEEGVGVGEEGQVHLDGVLLALEGDSLAGEVAELFAIYFFGREHRGSLLGLALKEGEGRFDV